MTTEQQQAQFDRMVDGEVSAEEQRRILLHCEESGHWRGLALAYVEAQVLGHDLNRLADESEIPSALSIHAGQSPQTAFWSPLTLAAVMLLCLGLGGALGWWIPDRNRTTPMMAQGAQRDDSAQLESNGSARVGSTPRSMPFLITDLSTNELQQIELPIVSAKELGPNWTEQLNRNVPDDLLDQMRKAGVNVVCTSTLMPVRTSEGRRVIVPIDYFFEDPYQ